MSDFSAFSARFTDSSAAYRSPRRRWISAVGAAMSDSGAVPLSMRACVSVRCRSASSTARRRTSTSRVAASSDQYARSTANTVSLIVRASTAPERVRSTAASRIARRVASTWRPCSSGCRKSTLSDVSAEGDSRARRLLDVSRDTPAAAWKVAPDANRRETAAVP